MQAEDFVSFLWYFLLSLLQGRSGDCELTLTEDDEITCVDEGLAIRFGFTLKHFVQQLFFSICLFSEMFQEPSVTSAAGGKYGADIEQNVLEDSFKLKCYI